MKSGRRVVAAGAVLFAAAWALSFIRTLVVVPSQGPSLRVSRAGWGLTSATSLNWQPQAGNRGMAKKKKDWRVLLRPVAGDVFVWPSDKTYTVGSGDVMEYQTYLIPHWLTNLVAWSLFIVLGRKARTYPKGHCQSCGYDLTGNETGACPECNAPMEVGS